MPTGAAALAAALWLLNFHGINMAILWISGRTSLLVTAAAALSVALLVRARLVAALAMFAVALFSKEEAVLLPLVGCVWWWLFARERRRDTVVMWLVGCGVILAVYFALRTATGAMTPLTAPSYYRLTFAPAAVARNIFEYADRSATFSVAIVLLAGLVLRRRPFSASPDLVPTAVGGLVWAAGAFATTLLLPVRSSLYVVLPSVGVTIVAAHVISRMWTQSAPARRRHALAVAVVLPFVLLPIYVARTTRYVSNAQFSTSVLEDLRVLAKDLPEGADVVLHDDRTQRANLASAFGTLLDDAYVFVTGRQLRFWIEPPPPFADPVQRPCVTCVDAEYRIVNGRVEAR